MRFGDQVEIPQQLFDTLGTLDFNVALRMAQVYDHEWDDKARVSGLQIKL